MPLVTNTKKALGRKSRGIDVVEPTRMAGWILPDADGAPTRLRLTVNDQVLGEVTADGYRSDLVKVIPSGKAAFDVKLHWDANDFAKQLPRRSTFRLTDVGTGEVLCEVPREGESDRDVFANPFGEPYVYYHKGGGFIVQLSARADAWWEAALAALKQTFDRGLAEGIPLQIGYGTLLGHVREGGFIPHDDDLDVIVHCGEQADAVSASLAFMTRVETLFGKNRVSFDTNGQAHVGFGGTRPVSLDVFASWTSGGRYYQNFAIAGGVAADAVFPAMPARFMGVDVRVPRDPEAVLAAIYGPGWRVPDPSFKWARPAAVDDFFRPLHNYHRNANKDYWEGYYARQAAQQVRPVPPSQFAAFATDFLRDDDLVVEFGCGNGRDSLFFARHGWRVKACDYAQAAVAANRKRAAATGAAGAAFAVCNVADTRSLDTFLADTDAAPRRAFYARFFLHAISEAAEEALRAGIDRHARPGDLLLVETRVAEDEARDKVTPDHFRRFVEADEAVRVWADLGWTAEYTVAGTGFAKYKDDDAHVLRFVMRKDG